jgi:dUTP pyrophosphatase
MPTIAFDPLHPGVTPPVRATEHSAGYDLRAFLLAAPAIRVACDGHEGERAVAHDGETPSVSLAPREKAIVPLGFRATLPPGYEAQVRPRSGTSFRTGLAIPNAPGTIDPDYNGEWGVLVRNDGAGPLVIRHGDRIAQMVITKYEVLEFQEAAVTRTTERDGGFGSTGHA